MNDYEKHFRKEYLDKILVKRTSATKMKRIPEKAKLHVPKGTMQVYNLKNGLIVV